MPKILAIKSGGIGDVLLALPALQALKRMFHPSALTIMGPSPVLPLLEGLASRTVGIESAAMAAWMGEEPDEGLVQFFTEHDLIISWFGYTSSEFRHNIEKVVPGRAHFFSPFPAEGGLHISDYYLKCVRSLGITPRSHSRLPCRLRLSMGKKHPPSFTPLEMKPRPLGRGIEIVRERGLKHRPRPVANCNGPSFLTGFTLAVHPGSGAAYKNWPPEKYIGLAHWAIDALDADVILVSGPADTEAVQAVSEGLRGEKVTIAHTLPLFRLAETIASSSLYIGNDSGVSHLAAATGIPTLAIYGPTDPRVWGVRGPAVSVLWKGLSCSPCSREEARRCPRRRCLEDISIEEVIQDFEINLAGKGTALHRDERV